MVSELYTDNNWLQCKTPRNFPVTRFTEEMSSSFSSLVFSLPLIFCDTLVGASISHFLTTATKISCCSSKIKCLLFFISHSSSLLLFVLLSFAGLVRSFSFSASKDTGGYAISCQNNLELLYLLIELFYTGMPVVWMDGLSVSRSVGNTVMWLPKSPWWVDKCIFLGMGLRSRAHGAPLITCISVFSLPRVCNRMLSFSTKSWACCKYSWMQKYTLINKRAVHVLCPKG